MLFVFLAYILKEINKINLEFQSETPRFHVALEMLTFYFKNILSNFVDLNLLNFEMLTVDNFDQLSVFKPLKDIYLGQKAQSLLQSQNLTNSQTIEIQQNCKQFYIILCKQILRRIDFKNPILNAVKILNPLSLGSSLMPLTTLFPNLVENDEHLELLESEWRLLILQNRSEEGLESFWKQMFCMKNSLGDLMYPNLKDFVGAILSLPHSSASPERVFSRMNSIKSFRRNCLDVGTVDSLLLVREMVTANEINNWVPSHNILREYKKS